MVMCGYTWQALMPAASSLGAKHVVCLGHSNLLCCILDAAGQVWHPLVTSVANLQFQK